MKVPPWSFSSITAFETCPKKYYHERIAKDVVTVQHEATVWGTVVHEHLEDRAAKGTPLPPTLNAYEPLVARIVNTPGTKLIEQQFAINEAMQPVAWGASDAWCRGIVDIGVLTSKRAVLLDWKTGKRKTDSDQLKLFAGLAFSHYPPLEQVVTGFVWLKEGKVDKQTFDRADAPAIWLTFIPRVERFRLAYTTGKFPPKPSGLCKRHCPVPRTKCEFSGKP